MEWTATDLMRIKALEKISRPKFLELLKVSKSEKAKEKLFYYRCATDFELYSKHYFAHYCSDPFNEFHEDSFRDYKFMERSVRRASAAPRGYAKSVLKALIKPVHDACYRLEQYIVIISNTDDQSAQKLKDIRAEFLENQRLIDAYDISFPNRRPAETDFVVSVGGHKVRYTGFGFKKEIRGVRFGNARPSKIVGDDLEHSEEVENEILREKYSNRFNDVVTKIGTPKTNIEIVGTVLHRKALLVDLLTNPRYKGRTYKSIESWAENTELWAKWKDIYTDLDNEDRLEDARAFYEANEAAMLKGTKVLWPEREPYYTLQEEIIESGIRSFMKEKQNSPQSDDEKIFIEENFRWFYPDEDIHPKLRQPVPGLRIATTGKFIPLDGLNMFLTMDPSTGQEKPKVNKKGDFTCMVWGLAQPMRQFDGKMRNRLFVMGDWTRRVAPTIYIKKLFDLLEVLGIAKVGVETNLYRNLLLQNILDEKKRREKENKKKIVLPLYDIEQVENKHKRIYTLEPRVSNGWILFNKNGISQEFKDQLLDFPKASHDDCPDALEMLWSLVHDRFKPAAITRGVMDR